MTLLFRSCLVVLPLSWAFPLESIVMANVGIDAENQDAATTQESDDYSFRTYRLENASAERIAHHLRELLDDFHSCTTDTRTNQIVLRAPAATLDLAQRVIDRLDAPSRDERPLQTVVVSPSYRPAAELAEVIKVHLLEGGRLVIDKNRNVAIVRDRIETIAAVREVVEKLDQPVIDFQLQFMVLGPSQTPLPRTADMVRIAEELAGLGLSGYGVLSQAGLITQENDSFNLTGQNNSGTLFVKGRIRLLPCEERAELQLELQVEMTPSEERQGKSHVGTTVKIPLGHVVLLGVTPAGGEPHEPLVIVTRANRM